MGLFSGLEKSKKTKVLKTKRVIKAEWSDFSKLYPSSYAKLMSEKQALLKPLLRPSTQIKFYFNADNISFSLVNVGGKEEVLSDNVLFKSWDDISLIEIDEFLV